MIGKLHLQYQCFSFSRARSFCLFSHFVVANDSCVSGSMRLTSGSGNMTGRVELCLEGKWGTVCNDTFNANAARVVCKQLWPSTIGNLVHFTYRLSHTHLPCLYTPVCND